MNKKILYLIILLFPLLMMARLPDLLSFGAPVSSSGAPGEVTCATSGCHDNFSVNSGNANLVFSIGNNISEYLPGHTYPITVSMSETAVSRFGFQLVVLKDSDSLNAGNLVITDAARTQIITNQIEFTDRQYITYTYQGTVPSGPGIGQWTFNWTAPAQNQGPVTLYVAGVSANDDNSDGGDHVYTASKKLTPDLNSSINKNKDIGISAIVFPNPVSKQLKIKLDFKGSPLIECSLFDIQGKLVKVLFEEKISSSVKIIDIDIPAAIYFLRIKMGDEEKITKIIVQ